MQFGEIADMYLFGDKFGAFRTCTCLPQAKLSEFKPFMKIKFGNPHIIGEWIGVGS
jgi:hypothetical protein